MCDDPLVSCRAKLKRFDEKMMELKFRVDSWWNSAYTIDRVQDETTGLYTYTIASLAPAPIEINLVIGEAIYCLRSCLDQLMMQLVDRDTGLVLRQDGTFNTQIQFPVFLTAKSFNSEGRRMYTSKRGGKVCRLISWQRLLALKRVQPWRGKGFKRLHPLWLLHHLAPIDKHRWEIQQMLGLDGGLLFLKTVTLEPGWTLVGGPARVGAPVLIAGDDLRVEGFYDDPDMRIKLVAKSRFGLGSDDATGLEIVPTLWAIRKYVAEEVLNPEGLAKGF